MANAFNNKVTKETKWIVYKHPDGQWVSLRKATEEDWHGLAQAMSAAIHDGKSLI